jgi:hypothetical protein
MVHARRRVVSMSARVVLIIGAAMALLFGLLLTLMPDQMLAGFGLDAPTAARVLSRDVGVTLVGLGLLNWLARNATGSTLRALLIANLFVQIAELVVNGAELAVGDLPAPAAGGLVIHIVLGALFAWALLRSPAVATAPATAAAAA